MKAARELVAFIQKSSQAEKSLFHAQLAHGVVTPLTVMADVITRWWSTYMMIKRLLMLKAFFALMALKGELEKNLSDYHWEILRQLEILLRPFKEIQKVLEGQKYVTLSLVPYLISVARSGLEKISDSDTHSPVICNLAKKMLEDETNGMYTYWGKGVDGTVFDENSTLGKYNRQKGMYLCICILINYLYATHMYNALIFHVCVFNTLK